MDRRSFEALLKRRTSRRLAIGGGVIGMSFAGRPTRSYARQATPAGTEATPLPADEVPLISRPSAQFGAYPFQLGVASGDPQPNSVVLWTRLAPAPLDGGGMDPLPYEVGWEVAADEAFATILQQGTTVADPNLAHSVHVDVTGLEPARDYFYRFLAGGEVSQVGRTRTAPAPGQPVDAVRFAMASCANYEEGYFVAYRDIAKQAPDFLIHLGDYIYEYAPTGQGVREQWGREASNLAGYRNRYALYRTDADLRAAHASTPFIVTWDDHEVANNYVSDNPEDGGPEDAFLRRRADAYQAYYEHMPLRPSSFPVGPDMTLYRRLGYGDLLDINVLDTRQYRTDQPSGDGSYPRTPNSLAPETTVLGPAQERWLAQSLDRSTSTWNAIAQQVIMAETYVPAPEGFAQDFYNDSWSGYPAARARLLQHLKDAAISNPVVLTGDIHSAWGTDLRLDYFTPGAETVGSEYVVTSISAGGVEPQTWGHAYKENFDYIRFYDGRHGGYTLVDVTADLWTADLYAAENLADPGSAMSHVATLVTEAGEPGVKEG